jgi:hypothetical protein
MKHGFLTKLLYTLLLVLINSLQSCDGNINPKKPISTAPEEKEEVTPANNPTPHREEKRAISNPQEGNEHTNNTAQQASESPNNSVDNPTPHSEEKIATSNTQERNRHANPINIAQQQELGSLITELCEQVKTNINNYLIQEPNKTAISSLEQVMKLLEAGTMNDSQLKIFEEAVNAGVNNYKDNYIKDFNATSQSPTRKDNFYVKKAEIDKQLVGIKACISNINKK